MKMALLQEAFVLHRRAYRETSFLIELFSRDHGRLTAVAKGVRKSRSNSQGMLQPFMPLLVSWAGKGELVTLTHAEAGSHLGRLQGEALFAGFYLNELMMCLLQKWDAHPELYDAYRLALSALQASVLINEKVLRSFEKYLLEALGYGLLPKLTLDVERRIFPEKCYRFTVDQGLMPYEEITITVNRIDIFSGKSLLAIAEENWNDEKTLQDAKRLTRLILGPLLGTRPLYSRFLFLKPDGGK